MLDYDSIDLAISSPVRYVLYYKYYYFCAVQTYNIVMICVNNKICRLLVTFQWTVRSR